MRVALANLLIETIMIRETVFYHCLHDFRVILWTPFCLVFVFSVAFTVFAVLTVCLSVMYTVYDFL